MEITLTAGDLASAIAVVKGVVSKRETIPILNNVLLDTASGQLTITGSSLDVEVSVSEPVEIVEHGRITVPGHVLFGLAKALPKTKLATLKIDGDRAILACGKSRYDLGTLPADDFPSLSGTTAAGAIAVTLPADVLRNALSATRHAHSVEDKAYFYLCGTHVTSEDDCLVFVATDRFKLVHIQTGVPFECAVPNVILPSDTVQAIIAIADKAAGDVTLTIDSSKIELAAGSIRLISKLLAGTYPDYKRVIPAGTDAPNFTAAAAGLADAIGRMGLVAGGSSPTKVKTNGTAIDLAIKGNNHGVETVEAAIGRSTEFLAPISCLSQLIELWPAGADLKFAMEGGGKPILITSDAAPNQKQIVMPMLF